VPADTSGAGATAGAPLPGLVPVSHDSAGSAIDRASFRSSALAGEGSFLVYLPPNYTSVDRYPVLYLLHGQDGHATAFLEVGLQHRLDRLIEGGAIPPMIAVMIQDRSTLNNWQDMGSRHSATYVIEVQELIDRMLPTMAARAGRAIAGSSKGGFGAMHVALANPYRFAVVESWLGYFNNLDGELRTDRPILSRLGLHAFLYGAVGDLAADPAENPAFAAELRQAGAQAESAVYPGNHSLTTVAEHLESMLLFAGRSLRGEQLRAAIDAWSPRVTRLFNPKSG
jgi:enterochelin esterase-like enzyme